MTVYYTRDHEWLRVEGDTAVVGITLHAADQLGDVVFVELPAVGKAFDKAEGMAVVESVKAASDVYAPATGEIIEVNGALEGTPGLVNEGAEGNGWFVKMRLSNPGEVAEMMDRTAYDAFVAGL
jgi:glycine cleavage system H protein